MTGTAQEGRAQRLWSGTSLFAPGEEAARAEGGLPFALVAAGVTAGHDAGPAPSALGARPLLGVEGLAPVRVPLVLDATGLDASPKEWAAFARGAAGVGAALLVRAAQARDRRDLLKASGLPLAVAVLPDEPAHPDALAGAAAVLVGLQGKAGAPALLDDASLPGLVEAVRSAAGYRVPVALLAAPGRAPSGASLQAAAAAGAKALVLACGTWPGQVPLAAMAGSLGAARALAPDMVLGLSCDEVWDGVALGFALAAGASCVSVALPLRLAQREAAAPTSDWKVVGDRLAHALRVVWEDAQRAAAMAGVRDPRDLTRDNLRAVTYEAAALSGLRLAGYGERLPWWAH